MTARTLMDKEAMVRELRKKANAMERDGWDMSLIRQAAEMLALSTLSVEGMPEEPKLVKHWRSMAAVTFPTILPNEREALEYIDHLRAVAEGMAADAGRLLESHKNLHLKLAKETIARRAWERHYVNMGWTEEGARLQTEMLIKEYADANAARSQGAEGV